MAAAKVGKGGGYADFDHSSFFNESDAPVSGTVRHTNATGAVLSATIVAPAAPPGAATVVTRTAANQGQTPSTVHVALSAGTKAWDGPVSAVATFVGAVTVLIRGTAAGTLTAWVLLTEGNGAAQRDSTTRHGPFTLA